MVEVFKTNVQNKIQGEQILKALKKKFPQLKINFDLQDCDKILRVDGKNIPVKEIIRILKSKKWQCEVFV